MGTQPTKVPRQKERMHCTETPSQSWMSGYECGASFKALGAQVQGGDDARAKATNINGA